MTNSSGLLTCCPERTPRRLQMTRQRPWRAENPDAVIVARPSKWGNPFASTLPHGEAIQSAATRSVLVEMYRTWIVERVSATAIAGQYRMEFRSGVTHQLLNPLQMKRPDTREIRTELAGKDLACWCPLDQPCHADVLLAIANGGSGEPSTRTAPAS